MSKKIKVIIVTIIMMIAMIIISSKSYAWSPSYQIPVFPQNNYFCKEKGAAVRFTKRNIETRVVETATAGYSNPDVPGSGRLNSSALIQMENVIANRLSNAMIKEMASSSEVDYAGISTHSGLILSMVSGWSVLDYEPVKNNWPWVVAGIIQAKTPNYWEAGTYNISNKKEAYILSAGQANSPMSKGLKQGNHTISASDTATDSDIQKALWADPDFNEGHVLSPNDLYNESVDYQNYIPKLTNYNASITSNEAQVIANRNEKTYILGPFKVTYPDDTRFSYIEDLYVTTDKDERIEPLDVIFMSKSAGNIYPRSGEIFFVKISGNNNPSKATVKVNFAYLYNTSATYTRFEGKGSITQEVGRVTRTTTASGTDHYYDPQPVIVGYDKDKKPIIEIQDFGYDYTWENYFYEAKISEETIGHYHAQTAAHRDNYSREWRTKQVSATLDLTMQLGGVVWEDTKGGKETGNDNVYDSSKAINNQTDRPIPGIIVTLYNQDGTIAELTKDSNPNNDAEEQIQNPTVTDSNGRYKFTGIDSMSQYYVQFTYNSQYYEPVEYVSPNDQNNGWGKGTWKINSNGTDVQIERENINARFASIGSSPENYQGTNGYNETFTKLQLMGYTLQEDGTYKKTREAVVDSHLICSNTDSNHEHTGQCYDTFGNLILESSNDETTKKMIQYVKDCQLNSYTGKDVVNGESKTRSNDLYPVPSIFVIDSYQYPTMLTPKADVLYDSAYYINQGYTQRRTADLALHKDINNIHVKINGKQQTYVYDTRTKDDSVSVSNPDGTKKGDTTWDMNIRLADGYYNTQYSREVYPSDYEYKVEDYNGNANIYGKTQDDELKVYITYKLTIKNQAQSIRSRIDEIIDYYDEDLEFDTSDEYIMNNSYMTTRMDGKTYTYAIKTSDKSRYNNTTMTKINGYDNLYIQPDGDVYMRTGQTEYVYITFRVKKDGNRNVLLDEKDWSLDGNGNIVSTAIGVGKENIAEINGYSTIYEDGTTVPNVGDVSGKPAGIIDRDSNPGNLKASDVPKDGKVNYNNMEDDTDKSPNVRLKLATTQDENNRILDGIVWEDLRTVTNDEQLTTVANGIMDNNETGINGVTVQLVEVMENGTEYIWKQFSTGEGTYTPIINHLGLATNVQDNTVGKYVFKSYPAGNYIVRFIYGDTVKTVLPNTQTDITKLVGKVGQNAKSYTGQDYKSTSYQVDIPEGKSFTFRNETIYSNKNSKYTSNESGKFYYDVTASDTNKNVSDAKDIMKDDNTNADYKRQNATLNSREDVENYSKLNVTNHIAEVLASQEQLQEYHKNDKDKVNSLLKELMEKTSMTAETGVINTEIEKDTQTTENQTVNNVITYKVQNVNLGLEERPKAQLAINKEITNVKVTLADGSTLFDAKQAATNVLWKEHKKYNLGYTKEYVLDTNKYGSIENIRKKNANDSRFGLIQLSMDEELMHGATIRISYTVTVSNVGEVDYDDDMFYYTGTASDVSKVVETQANQVIDYVANNLQFDSSNEENSTWEVISKKDLIDKGLVNSKLESEVEKYNTIITTKSNSNIAKTSLQPEIYNKDKSQVNDRLVLTQLITAENNSDDLTYRNIVEIVKTSNTVGRRNQYSVVGNQNPTKEPQELDSDISETVRILPPFGNAGKYIIIATTIILAIVVLSGGIIFIKKKILK